MATKTTKKEPATPKRMRIYDTEDPTPAELQVRINFLENGTKTLHARINEMSHPVQYQEPPMPEKKPCNCLDVSSVWWDGFTWGILALTALTAGMMIYRAHRQAQLYLEY